jgi:hypothetical protein
MPAHVNRRIKTCVWARKLSLSLSFFLSASVCFVRE